MISTARRPVRTLIALLAIAAAVTVSCGGKKLDKIPKDKDAGLTPAQLYEKGVGYSRKGRYFHARQILEKILSRPGVGPEILANTNLAIADAYYYDGGIINVAEALSRYTSFLTFYPTHSRADYVQYQLGLCYLKQTLGPDKDQATTRQALEAFRRVESGFPTSEFVTAAREKADLCRQRLCESHMRIGLFYQKRKAWDGAIGRFRSVLEDCPKYTRRDETTFRLAQALMSSSKSAEAQLYFQKLVDEYPKSRYASLARQALESLEASPGRTAEAPREKKSSTKKEAGPAERQGGR
jgi:outer membrane protein assembly factor BamD